ncbi:MAG: ankyrin repeat domain-containing protein [Opitutales bacterium]
MKISRRILCLFCAALTVVLTATVWAEAPKYDSIDDAIARGDLQDVKLQLEAFPERAKQGKHPKLAPLHQAILRKKTEIALVLIAAGADLDQVDGSKRTPLHLSVDRNLPKVAAALLKAGAKPNEWDKAGWTPLHNAAAKNRLDLVKVLVGGGADLKVLSERKGTPLHEAAASADADLVQYLLDQGVDPAVKAFDGGTAYDVALHNKNEAAIKLLKK